MLTFGFHLKDHTDVHLFYLQAKKVKITLCGLIITNNAMQYTYVDQQVVI